MSLDADYASPRRVSLKGLWSLILIVVAPAWVSWQCRRDFDARTSTTSAAYSITSGICTISTGKVLPGKETIPSLVLALYAAFATFKVYTWLASGRKHRQRVELARWWSRQTVVVTGGEGGLGKAIVNELQSKGCGTIASVDIGTKATVGSKEKTGPQTLYYSCDVASSESVQQTAALIRKHAGNPTILVSNAGIMVGKRVLDLTPKEFEKTLSVNTTATFYWVRELLPAMLDAKEGHILATASVMGYNGISQLSDYVASKHALVGFLESLRYELDKHYLAPTIGTTLLILGQLQTPLFARVHMLRLGKYIMPPQKPSIVARDVVSRLASQGQSPRRRRHGYIFRPWTARMAPILQAAPTSVRDFAQYLAGADEALQPPSKAHTQRWASQV